MRFATSYRCVDSRFMVAAIETLTREEYQQLKEVWIIREPPRLGNVPLVHNKTGRMLDLGHDWFITEVEDKVYLRAYHSGMCLLLVFAVDEISFCPHCGGQLPRGFDIHFDIHDCHAPKLTEN